MNMYTKEGMEVNATITTEWAIKEHAQKKELMEEDLPKQYQEYADVFSEEGAKCFPPP